MAKNLPHMPTAPQLDYQPLVGIAHAALPVFDEATQQFRGPGRIWLKGSESCRVARIVQTTEEHELSPPYYTALIEAPAGLVAVEFLSAGACLRRVEFEVPRAEALNRRGADFSALFFGDFQPFRVDDGKVIVNPGDEMRALPSAQTMPPTLVAARHLFQLAAEGRVGSFPRPAFACGVGDQVYVEGDYHSWGTYEQQHPMSAWTVEAQPRPRVGLRDLPRFLDTCYRANWSFPTFERALQACPTLMTWDDHDIRDGWGSQGDEHIYRDSYFQVLRNAYLEHQFSRGPRSIDMKTLSADRPLWQSFAVNGVPAFVLDLRSCRDISVPTIMGVEQWEVLRRWFAALDPKQSREYILVASVPLFFRISERSHIASLFSDEIIDDLLDTWTSDENEAEWKQMIELIAEAGARGLRGVIISGDYHVNSFCRVTAKAADGAPQVIAYEVIAAGLAADGFTDWKQQTIREGWLFETPIETSVGELSTEFGFAEACASFAGIEFRAGEVFGSLFETEASGFFEHRVPLRWSRPEESLAATVARSRAALCTATLLKTPD